MRIAYFDCPSGLAGNMILGALLDAGLDKDYLKKELLKLQNPKFKMARQALRQAQGSTEQSRVARHTSHPERNRGIQNNFQIQIYKIKKHGIQGTNFNIKIEESQHHRNLGKILRVINRSKLSKRVKSLSGKIFRRLAEAEAKVHGIPISKVHFHEVGAIDAIVDIVGSCVGFEKLGIEKIYCSPLPHGKGMIKHAHGILPNPAPATVELLKGIPTYGVNIKGELVTPTGAAIISTLAESFGDIPRMKAEKIGYGAGTFNLPLPNLLRVFIGEAGIQTERDAVLQIETNIDDMNPKLYPKVIQKLMGAGALDAYIHPILMKKNRRAINLTVLCDPERRDRIIEEIFNQTTTLGVRTYLVPREKLTRKLVSVRTKYGKARVKLGFLGKELKTVAPEYEDYRRIARKHHIPIRTSFLPRDDVLSQFCQGFL